MFASSPWTALNMLKQNNENEKNGFTIRYDDVLFIYVVVCDFEEE